MKKNEQNNEQPKEVITEEMPKNEANVETRELEQDEPELSEFDNKLREVVDALKVVEIDQEKEAFILLWSRDLGKCTRASGGIVGKGINLKRILYNVCKNDPIFEGLLVEVSMMVMVEKHATNQ